MQTIGSSSTTRMCAMSSCRDCTCCDICSIARVLHASPLCFGFRFPGMTHNAVAALRFEQHTPVTVLLEQTRMAWPINGSTTRMRRMAVFLRSTFRKAGLIVIGRTKFQQANQGVAFISAADKKNVCPLPCIGTEDTRSDVRFVYTRLSNGYHLRVNRENISRYTCRASEGQG